MADERIASFDLSIINALATRCLSASAYFHITDPGGSVVVIRCSFVCRTGTEKRFHNRACRVCALVKWSKRYQRDCHAAEASRRTTRSWRRLVVPKRPRDRRGGALRLPHLRDVEICTGAVALPLTLLFSAIILLVVSRAYLGVHYASDVIGGFAVGAFSCGSVSCCQATAGATARG